MYVSHRVTGFKKKLERVKILRERKRVNNKNSSYNMNIFTAKEIR